MKKAKRIDSPSVYLLFARRGAKRIYNFVVMFMGMHCANFVIAVYRALCTAYFILQSVMDIGNCTNFTELYHLAVQMKRLVLHRNVVTAVTKGFRSSLHSTKFTCGTQQHCLQFSGAEASNTIIGDHRRFSQVIYLAQKTEVDSLSRN